MRTRAFYTCSGIFAVLCSLSFAGCSEDRSKGGTAPDSGGSHHAAAGSGAASGRAGASGGGASNAGTGATTDTGGASGSGSGGDMTTGGVTGTGSGGAHPEPDGGDGAGVEGGEPDPCSTADIDGVEVAPVDLDAFPAYAVDGCTLVFVNTNGQLVRWDLKFRTETMLASANEMPRRPTLSGPVTAWEATEAGRSVVRVRMHDSTITIAGSFDHAGEPKATSDAVVFTGWLDAAADGDTDVFVWTVAGARTELALGGAGQQRFADISPSYVAVSDFSEDPAGHYTGDGTSLADVVLVDRTTGKLVRRQLPGKQAFPMLGSSDSLVYLEWTEVHPVPKLQDYTIRAVPIATPSADAREIAHVTSLDAVRPTANAGHVEWVSRYSTTMLFQAPLDGSGPVVPVALPGIAVAHAPVSTPRFTVLAVRQMQNDVPRLDLVSW